MTLQETKTLDHQTSPRKPVRYSTFALDYLGLLLALLGLVVIFSIRAPGFFSLATFSTIANQVPATIVVAVGMTYVLIIAGIDLSVGSVLAVSGAVLGVLMKEYHQSLAVAVLAALGTGLLCGALNGLVSVHWRLPSFIVTLGMLEIARGATHLITESRTQYIGSSVGVIASTAVYGISLPFIVAILTAIVGQIVLSRTVFGRYMIAIGTNEEAVRLSGVDPRPVKIAVFTLIGLLSALGAVIDTARLEAAAPNAGAGLELQVIAAVVIGGTSLMGGRGSVVRSLFGVLIIAVLGAGLAAEGVKDATKSIITGCVIVAAVILDYYRHRLGKRASASA
ncbi:MAG: ABC transporter permease [Bacillota bacterium]